MFKQVIAVRADLKLGKGKLAAQVAHASLGAYRYAGGEAKFAWEHDGEKKVVVKARDAGELARLEKKARSLGIPCALITDAGRTQVEAGTMTAIGLGPADEKALDSIAGHLKLM
ncbi:MAG: peptidyl-tRNA hydrolase [Candidatus Aenigmarchaeota archaeon]|nr:peptidyl-tRNA hydrolase [Candidatus Aenigmarchaeota archaeon]